MSFKREDAFWLVIGMFTGFLVMVWLFAMHMN